MYVRRQFVQYLTTFATDKVIHWIIFSDLVVTEIFLSHIWMCVMCVRKAAVFLSFLPPAYVVRREGSVFTGVCLFTPGGVPHLHPIILPLVPRPFRGRQVPHIHSIILPLVPCTFWGYPPSPGMGYPPARSGWGVPLLCWDGLPLQQGQQREYLLRGGRYASCVHTGGLFCLKIFCDNVVHW